MSNSLAMTAPAWAVLVMFLMMATSHLVVEPAYYGYLVGFAVFAVLTVRNLFDFSPRGFAASGGLFAWAIFATWVFAVTAFAHPAFRDLFRDMGAVLSFSVGFFLIPRGLGRNWERTLLSAFSVLSMVLSVWVIASAGRAYLSGASAYEWRGAYVPFAHTWLPYLIVAEYLRSRLPQFKPECTIRTISQPVAHRYITGNG